MKPQLARFQISRRSFVKRCATIAAASGLPFWFVERQLRAAESPIRKLAANDRPGIAVIDCGGMGMGDAMNASNHGEIVAVCDVDSDHAQAGAHARSPFVTWRLGTDQRRSVILAP